MSQVLTQEMREAAIRSLGARRATQPEHINQMNLPAGSPITLYCTSCGWISDIMPEDYFLSTPRKLCSECAALAQHGGEHVLQPDP